MKPKVAKKAGPSPSSISHPILLDLVQELEERQEWYKGGCEGLENRKSYLKSGDVLVDVASDLDCALTCIRYLRKELEGVVKVEKE